MQSLLFFLAAFLPLGATGPFSVRLSGGPNLCIGRVEVFHRGQWGTVCDDEWDMLDVAVVCQELDCGEALSAPHGAWFGEGTGPIWLNEVRCTGTERHLHACRHRGFRKHVCTHEEDASAICSVQRFSPFTASFPPPTVRGYKMETVTSSSPAPSVPAERTPALRLVGGRSRCSGRVEVFHQGQWGTVCDDMWGLPDVAVVCRELGCGEALGAPVGAIFGEGNGVIWLDDVRCEGGELTLTECLTSPWGTHNCRHSEDAGAVCSDEMPLTMAEEHLTMITRTLAPQRPQPITHWRSLHPTQPTRDQAESVAYETSWHTGKSSKEGHPEAMLPGQWQVRLAGGAGSCAGRVEVLYKDSWGTVCDDGWDQLDARVVCRELGCGAPLLSPGNARYGPGTGPIWLDDVNCTGKESSLQHCQSQPWGQHNCNHHEDASVICTGRWKPLSLPEPATDSNVAELTPITQVPSPTDESGLQNILDTAAAPTQSSPPAWDMEFPHPGHPDERFLSPTHEMELEVEKEGPTSLQNLQETFPEEEVLQDFHDVESSSPQKTRSPPRMRGLEPTDPSVESQPLSAVWDVGFEGGEPTSPPGTVMLKQGLKLPVEIESSVQWDNIFRETEPPSPPGMVTPGQSFKAAMETVPSVQWDVSREPPATPKREPSTSSSETEPTSATWAAEPDRETESTGFSRTELLPVTQDLQDTMVTETQFRWDETPGEQPATRGPTSPSAETQPTTWVWESERETESAIHRGVELLPSSESVEATRETEMPTAAQNAQPTNGREETSPEAPDAKGDTDLEQTDRGNEGPHTVRPIDTVSTKIRTMAPGTNEPSAEPVTPTAHIREASLGCTVGQEARKQGRDCCGSLDTLGNMVDAMDGLRGELGSVSTAIQQQGAQLEAVARSLAQLATSVHQLVAVLPALRQPVPAPPSAAPCRQEEGDAQNQLPLK